MALEVSCPHWCCKLSINVLCWSGQFIIAMFVFVNALMFTRSCLASIFFYIGKPGSQEMTALGID